jgi:hypothetical protein
MESRRYNVIELRNYLNVPGKRDEFINYFNAHFIGSQQELGGDILGEYRIAEAPDRFVWIRGFENMAERSRFLPAFYYGDTWNKFGAGANAMMLEWHHVHLLKPAFNDQTAHPFKSADADSIVVIDFYTAQQRMLNELVDFFNIHCLARMKESMKVEGSYWVSEMGENDFPRLPVIQDDHLFVSMINCKDLLAYDKISKELFSDDRTMRQLQQMIARQERVILYPAIP